MVKYNKIRIEFSIKLFLMMVLTGINTINCNMKVGTHYEYWNQFFSAHHDIKKTSFMGGEYDILFGGLKPEKETIMHTDANGDLVMSVSVSKKGDKLTTNLNAEAYPDKDSVLHIHTSYSLKEFRTKETYVIKRVSHFSGKEYTILNFINWYYSILENTPDLKELQKSNTFNVFCKYYNCTTENSESGLYITFIPNSKLKEIDSAQFSRLMKFLDLAIIDLKISAPSGEVIFHLTNNKKYYKIYIPQMNISDKLGTFQISSSINLDYYGLKINLNEIGYNFIIEKIKNNISTRGFYNKYPKIIISGKLWHILPPVALDLLIPGNMNEYFKDYFDMLFKGSTGKGNFMNIISSVNQSNVDMVIINHSEVYRKPFRLFGSPSKQEKQLSIFNNEFEKAILEDLK
jgi:hypothetical protein